jgi:rhodanese-related sulfurtransferase
VPDVRDTGQFTKEHVPGASNIEWRQVFAQRAKLPKDKTILVYSNTSSFATQVAMALRLGGVENLRLLYGGFNEWKSRGGMEAHARSSKKGGRVGCRPRPLRLLARAPLGSAAGPRVPDPPQRRE